jgi:hypothetical protein
LSKRIIPVLFVIKVWYIMPLDGSINTIPPIDASYVGLYYAYEASGGFIIEQGVGSTTIYPYSQINRYDVTDSLQVKYDVRTFNEKLGLIKDASNIEILSTTYNPDTDSFDVDYVTLTAVEFASAVIEEDIISVGFYTTLYMNFQILVNNYFGYPEGFNALFTTSSQMDINNGIFDASAMVNIMHYSELNASGEYVNTMTGTLQIEHINSLLRYVCQDQNNPFNNRTTQTVADGFIENDLIYVPTGTTITLVADIINSDTSDNYIIPTTPGLEHIIESSPGPDFSNGDYSQLTTFTANYIMRVVKVPLLIVLKNLS